MPPKDYVQRIIEDYERDLMPFRFVFYLSDGETVSLVISPGDVPHLLGIRKLQLRQAQNKSAEHIYNLLKTGRINLTHFASHKEEYKKVMNFPALLRILYCGDAVRVVKKRGSLNSRYLFYIDHSPDEIIHLGVVVDGRGCWHPESLLVLQSRSVDAYIRDQLPVSIVSMEVKSVSAAP